MKVNLKRIFAGIGILLVVGYLLAMAVWGGAHRDERECRAIQIEITDLDKRQYVTTDELLLLLRREQLYTRTVCPSAWTECAE